MTKPPLHQVLSRVARLPLDRQAEELKKEIKQETRRSKRRKELEDKLCDINLRAMRHCARYSA